MKRLLNSIPNLLTLCNLLSGCVAILAASQANYSLAFWAVVVAAVFDFFDGFSARMLHATSPIGKQLDSLADMVSFGVAPTVVLWMMISSSGLGAWPAFGSFLLVACSALRLAKFNIDERQTEEFLGLPTPACALFFVALPMAGWSWIEQPGPLLALTLLFSALLVCEIPMFSLKFKTFGLKENALHYVFLLISLGCVAWLRFAAPVVIIPVYALISMGRALVPVFEKK